MYQGEAARQACQESAWTMEAPPQNMDPPKLQVTGSESIEITWKLPRIPNGRIRSYELRRDGTIVYTGLETRIMTLLSPQVWSMAIQWWPTTAKGCFESTCQRSNQPLQRLQGWNLQDCWPRALRKILVTWDPPVRTNGHIVNYTLFIRELFERETKIIHINTTHNSFGPQSFTVNQLKPFHR